MDMRRWTRLLNPRDVARRLAELPWRLLDRSAERHSRHAALARYLYYEVSELRTVVRQLAAESGSDLTLQTQTRSSFDHQWRELNESVALLSSVEFRAAVPDLACQLTDRPREWFAGKRVLDAGCGSGRFSYAFATLGANVVAIDQSAGALDQVRKACEGLAGEVTTVTHDVLRPLDLGTFDLVWSFGVLHHTGNTYAGLRNVAAAVAPGGYLFLMLYGEPEITGLGALREQAEYSRLRRMTQNRTLEETLHTVESERPGEDVHGWFDAISPRINDKYTFEEIEGWLLAAGFEDIRKTSESSNHHVVARRAITPEAQLDE